MSQTLNDAIVFILRQYDAQVASQWNQYSPVAIAGELSVDIQRVNHFLRIQLGLMNMDTTAARECLTNETDHQAWLDGFEEYIVPVLVNYGLPVWQS